MKTEEAIDLLLTRPQKVAVNKMTKLGYSRLAAVRRLLKLGILALESESWPTHETN